MKLTATRPRKILVIIWNSFCDEIVTYYVIELVSS